MILRDIDRRIWAEELDEFVPRELYDAHTHVYDWRADSPDVRTEPGPPLGAHAEWPLSTWQALDEIDAALLPGRRVHRISFGSPLQPCPLDQANAFAARQVAADPASVALMLVRPDLPPAALAESIARHGFCGVKPYRTHAVTGDAVECRITDYLPEAQIEVVNQHGLMVMLHLAKRRAIADEDNLADLERLTRRYRRVRWVLAHCARSYYDRPLLAAAQRLKAIPNLWYEISSVCDAGVMEALLSVAGCDRVMYGSDDLLVGVTRGKYITFGFSWAELNERNHQLNLSHCDGQMTFVRYECLRAFRRACRQRGCGPAEIRKLFYENAKSLIDSIRR